MRHATRIYYTEENGSSLEYDGDIYPNLRAAKTGVKAQRKEFRAVGMIGKFEYQIHEWHEDPVRRSGRGIRHLEKTARLRPRTTSGG